MKKYFFYAAMAVATMASCTSEDDLTVDPVNPTPDAEEKVALNLGVATPAMTVGSRGTGMVGYVGSYVDKSSWDSQQLFVTMVNKTTNKVYNEPDGQPYFAGIEFRAPKADVADNNKGLIRMYQSYNGQPNDNGILEYKYYPVPGEYTFYGWHVDDAVMTLIDEKPDTIIGKVDDGGTMVNQAILKGIKIDGTQDLLAANTEVIPDQQPTVNTAPYYDAANAFVTGGGDYDEMVDKQFSDKSRK